MEVSIVERHIREHGWSGKRRREPGDRKLRQRKYFAILSIRFLFRAEKPQKLVVMYVDLTAVHVNAETQESSEMVCSAGKQGNTTPAEIAGGPAYVRIMYAGGLGGKRCPPVCTRNTNGTTASYQVVNRALHKPKNTTNDNNTSNPGKR